MAFTNNHTLIAKGTVIRGELHFSGELQIEGKVLGSIIAAAGGNSRVVVAEQGEIEGAIYAPRVLINGKVDGQVYAPALVELAKKAAVTGVIYYHELQVVQGATINANLLRTQASDIPVAPADIGSILANLSQAPQRESV